MSGKSGYIVALLLSITAFAISANALPAIVTTVADDLGTPYQRFGYIFSAQYFAYALASLAGAFLLGRFALTRRRLVLVGLSLMAVTLAMLGGPWIFWQFAVIVLVMGFAGGLTETFTSILVLESVPGRSSQMLCLSQMFYCVGSIGAPQVMAVSLAWGVSWQSALGGLATVIAACAILFAITSRFGPAELTPNPPDGQSTVEDTPHEHTREHPDMPEKTASVVRPFRWGEPVLYLLAGTMFTFVLVEISLACWTAAYFEKALGVSQASAAWRPAAFWTGVVLSRAGMFFYPGHLPQRKVMIGCSVALTVALLLLHMVSYPLAATLLLVVVGVVSGPMWPLIVSTCQQISPGTQLAPTVIATGALAAAAVPAVDAFLIELWGIDTLMLPMAVFSAVLVVLVLVGRYHTAHALHTT